MCVQMRQKNKLEDIFLQLHVSVNILIHERLRKNVKMYTYICTCPKNTEKMLSYEGDLGGLRALSESSSGDGFLLIGFH